MLQKLDDDAETAVSTNTEQYYVHHMELRDDPLNVICSERKANFYNGLSSLWIPSLCLLWNQTRDTNLR